MALYIPHSIFHLARLLYVRPETFGSYYVYFTRKETGPKCQKILVRRNRVLTYYVQYIYIHIYIYMDKGCNYVDIYSPGNKSFLLLGIFKPLGSDGRSGFIVVHQVRCRYIFSVDLYCYKVTSS